MCVTFIETCNIMPCIHRSLVRDDHANLHFVLPRLPLHTGYSCISLYF